MTWEQECEDMIGREVSDAFEEWQYSRFMAEKIARTYSKSPILMEEWK